MDTTTDQVKFFLSHPAYLYIGNTDTLVTHTIELLQKQFCTNGQHMQACSVCISCRKIVHQQHELVLWINPEKQYSIDDLDIIFKTIAFTLDPGQHFYFVLQKADLLTTTCANALLKSLEEPPAGYHFLLLASRSDSILPTIKSRCFIEQLQNTQHPSVSALFPFFTTRAFQDPLAFAKELDSTNPHEWDSLALLDQLLAYWSGHYKKSVIERNQEKIKEAQFMIDALKKAIEQPPMPGSSKLFWKNFFLQIKSF